MGPTVLFQLTFTYIYSTFSKKYFSFSKISGSQTNPKFVLLFLLFNLFLLLFMVLLHFLVLFVSLTVLFQLPFSFIYNTFSKIFSISAK